MVFCFARSEPNFTPIYINGTEIKHLKEKNNLCVILSDNLKCNAHIGEIVRKANKRLFFLTLLKNACPYREDLVDTYTSLVRPIVEYACPLWHLCASGLVSLKDRRVKICSDLFNEMCKPDHKLNHLISKPCERSKSLRNALPIDPPKFRTNRYRDTFIPYALMNFQ